MSDPRPNKTAQFEGATRPHSPPIYLSSVYECIDPEQADELLGGAGGGYVYARDGHPNADALASEIARLHRAERAAVTASGMAALAAVVLSQLKSGDHIVASRYLYGRSLTLLVAEAARLGIGCTVVDTCDLSATESAIGAVTRLLVVETITNPILRVSDLASLADLTRRRRIQLVVDNTFASPVLCRPLALGADWVIESLTKVMNGHSDVVLGAICGREGLWDRVPGVISTWGLAGAPFECWLAQRGLATLPLRAAQAGANALRLAEHLSQSPAIGRVRYPGLPTHPDHLLAKRQFNERFGTIVTFDLAGGRAAADAFIRSVPGIPFCPSLGELTTTLSHPESTSHRALSAEERAALGITGGTIRLSVGIEPAAELIERLDAGLAVV